MFKDVCLLDVDGVLANFVNALIRSHRWPITHDEYVGWDHHRTLGVTDDVMWAPTREAGWWLAIDPYPWATELFAMIASTFEKVVFCTSPAKDEKCPSEKVAWLRKHGFLAATACNYQIGPMKELNAMSGAVLIDDSQSNVDKYIACSGKAILFPQPWNDNRSFANDPVGFVHVQLKELRCSK